MLKYLSNISEKQIKAKTAILRLDFNTEDDWRMKEAIPTIKFLLNYGDKVVILSHRGRPQGEDTKLSLKKDAKKLSCYLKKKIVFIPKLDLNLAKKIILKSPEKIFLLENLRFSPLEEKNDLQFAAKLAALGDIYINDAFAVSHRANASVVAITKFLPSYGGLELEKEIKNLSLVMQKAKHPLVIILGGAKISDKLGMINFFSKKADKFLLGGGLANTLLASYGKDVKKSLFEKDHFLNRIKFLKSKKIILPIDYVWQKEMILDIGPKTADLFSQEISLAKTIIWNGPLGFIEEKKFIAGSLKIAKSIAANHKAFSVAGGGETVMFLKKYHLDKKISFISTGGGAMLDFLAGKKLPAIEALKNGK